MQPRSQRKLDGAEVNRLVLGLLFAVSCWAQTSVRVNVGGPVFTDSGGNPWQADTGCSSTSIFTRAVSIANTSDPTLYQTGRSSTSTIGCTYSVDNFSFFYVTLLFAETDPTITRAGQRVFNIFINGILVQSQFDPFARSGQFATAIPLTFGPLAIYNSTVSIVLAQVTGQPILQGVDIESAGSSGGGTVTHATTPLLLNNLAVGNGLGDLKVGDLSGDVTTSGSLATVIGASKVLETMLGLTDLTTANATTLKHGLLPKLDGSATKALLGDGTWGTFTAANGVTYTSGTGAPSSSCTAGQNVYLDTTNLDYWFCNVANTWKKIISTVNTGTFSMTGQAGTTPATPSAGLATFFFDSALSDAPSVVQSSGTKYALGRVIARGTKALATAAISSAACTSAQTDTATGAATSDTVVVTFASDPSGVTGYVPLTAGGLSIYTYVTANTFNAKVCNFTASSITPGALSLNWLVTR